MKYKENIKNFFCPTCKKKISWNRKNHFFPFCSEICKSIDLIHWITDE